MANNCKNRNYASYLQKFFQQTDKKNINKPIFMKENKGVNVSSIAALVNSLVLVGMCFLPWFTTGFGRGWRYSSQVSLWDTAIISFDHSYTTWFGIVFFVLFGALILNAVLKLFTTTKWLNILLTVLLIHFIIIAWLFFEAAFGVYDFEIGFILFCVFTVSLFVPTFLPTGKPANKHVEQKTNIVNQYAPDNFQASQRARDVRTSPGIPVQHESRPLTRNSDNSKEQEIEELRRRLAMLEGENSSKQKQMELEAQRQREREIAIQQQKEAAILQQRAMEARRQRETAMQQQRAAEAQRQRAAEEQRQKEIELQRQRMAAQQQPQAQQKPRKPIAKTTIDRSRFQ